MNWTVRGGMVHVTIPHGTVVLTEAQLKAMVKGIQDERGRERRRDLKMPDSWPHTGHGKL